LSLRDTERAAEHECRNERSNQDRAILFAHDINPRTRTRPVARAAQESAAIWTPHDATPSRFAQF
jgi:hypothetical protein